MRTKPGVLKKTIRYLLGVIAVGALILVVFEGYQLATESTFFSSYLANLYFKNNFHPVINGRLYRSGQMSEEELREIVLQHNIRTVLDLRLGEDEANEQGMTEEETVTALGVQYLRVPLRGSRMPSKEDWQKLLIAYDSSPTPILIHCSSGTHRSGIAAAVWLLDKEGATVTEASEQLSPKYGFFKLERKLKSFLKGKETIDNAFEHYAEAKGKNGLSFRAWVEGLPPSAKPK